MDYLRDDVMVIAEALSSIKDLMRLYDGEIISAEVTNARGASIHVYSPGKLREMFDCKTSEHDGVYNRISTVVNGVEIFALEEK